MFQMNIIKHVTQKNLQECMNFAIKLIIIKSITNSQSPKNVNKGFKT